MIAFGCLPWVIISIWHHGECICRGRKTAPCCACKHQCLPSTIRGRLITTQSTTINPSKSTGNIQTYGRIQILSAHQAQNLPNPQAYKGCDTLPGPSSPSQGKRMSTPVMVNAVTDSGLRTDRQSTSNCPWGSGSAGSHCWCCLTLIDIYLSILFVLSPTLCLYSLHCPYLASLAWLDP